MQQAKRNQIIEAKHNDLKDEMARVEGNGSEQKAKFESRKEELKKKIEKL